MTYKELLAAYDSALRSGDQIEVLAASLAIAEYWQDPYEIAAAKEELEDAIDAREDAVEWGFILREASLKGERLRA